MSQNVEEEAFIGVRCNLTAFEYQLIPPQECRMLYDGLPEDSLPLIFKPFSFNVQTIHYGSNTSQISTSQETFVFPVDDEPTLYVNLNLPPLSTPDREAISYRLSTLPVSNTLISFCSFSNCITLPRPNSQFTSFRAIPFLSTSDPVDPNHILYINKHPHTIQFLPSSIDSSPALIPPSSDVPFFYYVRTAEDTLDPSLNKSFTFYTTVKNPSSLNQTSHTYVDNRALATQFRWYNGANITKTDAVNGRLTVNHKAFAQKNEMSVVIRTLLNHYSLSFTRNGEGDTPEGEEVQEIEEKKEGEEEAGVMKLVELPRINQPHFEKLLEVPVPDKLESSANGEKYEENSQRKDENILPVGPRWLTLDSYRNLVQHQKHILDESKREQESTRMRNAIAELMADQEHSKLIGEVVDTLPSNATVEHIKKAAARLVQRGVSQEIVGKILTAVYHLFNLSPRQEEEDRSRVSNKEEKEIPGDMFGGEQEPMTIPAGSFNWLPNRNGQDVIQDEPMDANEEELTDVDVRPEDAGLVPDFHFFSEDEMKNNPSAEGEKGGQGVVSHRPPIVEKTGEEEENGGLEDSLNEEEETSVLPTEPWEEKMAEDLRKEEQEKMEALAAAQKQREEEELEFFKEQEAVDNLVLDYEVAGKVWVNRYPLNPLGHRGEAPSTVLPEQTTMQNEGEGNSLPQQPDHKYPAGVEIYPLPKEQVDQFFPPGLDNGKGTTGGVTGEQSPAVEEEENKGKVPGKELPEGENKGKVPSEELPEGEENKGKVPSKQSLQEKGNKNPSKPQKIGGEIGTGEESFWNKHGGKMGALGGVMVLILLLVIYKLKRKSPKKELLMEREEKGETQEESYV